MKQKFEEKEVNIEIFSKKINFGSGGGLVV
jgi:hypothetical protein